MLPFDKGSKEMTGRIEIRDCVKQGYRFPQIVAYDTRNQPWIFVGVRFNRGDARMSKLLARVREAGSIDPQHWRKK